jgi:hypothetical protein
MPFSPIPELVQGLNKLNSRIARMRVIRVRITCVRVKLSFGLRLMYQELQELVGSWEILLIVI